MRVVTIVGARPQFIKAAPVSIALALSHHNEIVVHTGQHYDPSMSDVFFDELCIPTPKYNLGVGSGGHAFQTGNILIGLEEVLIKEKPDIVLLYGDTNSTVAGALAAVKLHIPVVHIEGGVRSYDMCVPEEVNRVLTDRVSHIIFVPTKSAAGNLKNEGYELILNNGDIVDIENLIYSKDDIKQGFGIVCNIGDVMYDAALMFSEIAKEKSGILEELNLKSKQYVLATIHRPQNTDDAKVLLEIINGLDKISEKTTVVFPMHPRVQKAINQYFGTDFLNTIKRNIIIINPVSYFDMLILEKNAGVIITDSGGVQHEAAFYKIPCVTVLDKTPWIESVENGWNRLCGTSCEEIYNSYVIAKNSNPIWKGLSCYGYGDAAKRFVKVVERIMNIAVKKEN
ncbi:MAG: UDP-N-acetyl glucosamine 2-epimerase [Pelosinus sp.]|nr:UDP-N-acetyl glucosamine 2-epimerase [Pelosinus sp.]